MRSWTSNKGNYVEILTKSNLVYILPTDKDNMPIISELRGKGKYNPLDLRRHSITEELLVQFKPRSNWKLD